MVEEMVFQIHNKMHTLNEMNVTSTKSNFIQI